MGFLDFLMSFFKPKSDPLLYDIQQLENKLNNCETERSIVNEKNISYLQELSILKKNSDPKLKEWDEKYPEGNIDYTGRVLFDSKKPIPVDVKLYITPQDHHIKEYLTKWGLIWNGTQPIDEFVVALYKKIQDSFFSYETDFQKYGLSEFWEFPFEVLNGLDNFGKGKMDCDSWAHVQASFYIASGIPKERVRVVCGVTSQKLGHSTVYVLNDSLTKWHHLNSTSDYNTFKHLTNLNDFPSTDDAYSGKDLIGIKDVWFSFRNDKAWSVFKTGAVADSFNENGKNLFKISGGL